MPTLRQLGNVPITPIGLFVTGVCPLGQIPELSECTMIEKGGQEVTPERKGVALPLWRATKSDPRSE
jgi:hypothetical protein